MQFKKQVSSFYKINMIKKMIKKAVIKDLLALYLKLYIIIIRLFKNKVETLKF